MATTQPPQNLPVWTGLAARAWSTFLLRPSRMNLQSVNTTPRRGVVQHACRIHRKVKRGNQLLGC
ncbi:MAG: hypothetical protein ABI782_13085, partial [Anaerolineaceae bacterium]